MRKPIIAGNWKMNKLTSEAVELARELKNKAGSIADREIVLCLPFTVLSSVKEVIEGSSIRLGARICTGKFVEHIREKYRRRCSKISAVIM